MGASDKTADPFETGPPPVRATATDAPATPAFPVAGWERYQPVRFLGQGGMGRVFLARDPRLHRDVAIKLVRGDDPDLSRRLVLEARSQARVHHERVCQVYEVGEVSGHVYIAMQHIDGAPLGALAGELNVAQKALVLREAALGAHEAHKAGILHRDLKPSNILIERAEDGSLKPYLVDFGLARAIPEGATATSAAVGTPHYMSPEQARGDTRALDRRSDVYSLGATLYHLLAGEPPIDGENTLDILSRIATVEPRPLRAIDPAIPADLEAVVLKCLEKERPLRYDSARALAADLDRFLNGEPVLARPTSLFQRLRRRVVRHRRLAAVIGAALVVAGVAVGFGIKARLEAAERAREAQRFTEEVERIEAEARYSALSPLHDVRPDRLALRAEMDSLAAEIHRAGALSEGPGNYALGRGALSLGEAAEARAHLELAWKQGYREPRVAYALAIVLGDVYQAERLNAERLRDAPQRQARLREIERKARDPALAFLKQAGGAHVPSPHYMAARLASYEDRLDDALAELDAVGDGLPWFYEGPALRGTLLATRASRRWNAGDHAGAAADFEAGRRAYERASAIGESVPAVYEAKGELEYAAMVMELYGEGNVEPTFERGALDAARALTAEPDDPAALLLDARLHRRMAEHRGNQGVVADDLLRRAIASAERAIALAPEKSAGRMELGQSYWQWGQSRSERGQDPSEALQKAAAVFEAFRPEDRDYDYYTCLGLVFDSWADYKSQSGADPLPDRARAMDAYRAATALDDSLPSGWLNLGNEYLLRASAPNERDPDADLSEALRALDKARARNPGQVVAYIYSGDAHALVAQRGRARGRDAGPELALALSLYREGLAINPKMPYLHNGVGTILLAQAREAWDRGAAPEPLIQGARAAFEQAIAVAPDQGFGYHNVGDALAQEVHCTVARGADPRPAAALAIAAIEKAVERLPDIAPPRANLGMVHALLAACEFEQGRDPGASAALAEAALAGALSRNPEDSQSHLYLGEVRGTMARYRAKKGRGLPEDFEAAAREYQKAQELAPEDQDTRIAVGHFERSRAEAERAAGRDPGPALARALARVAEVLSARPSWPDALVLRGSLWLFEAEGGAASAGREAAGKALLDFNAALAANPSLAGRWKDRAAAAQRLAAGGR